MIFHIMPCFQYQQFLFHWKFWWRGAVSMLWISIGCINLELFVGGTLTTYIFRSSGWIICTTFGIFETSEHLSSKTNTTTNNDSNQCPKIFNMCITIWNKICALTCCEFSTMLCGVTAHQDELVIQKWSQHNCIKVK